MPNLKQQLDELEGRIEGKKHLARAQRAEFIARVRHRLTSPWVFAGACVAGVFVGRSLFHRRTAEPTAAKLRPSQRIVAWLRWARRMWPYVTMATAAARWVQGRSNNPSPTADL